MSAAVSTSVVALLALTISDPSASEFAHEWGTALILLTMSPLLIIYWYVTRYRRSKRDAIGSWRKPFASVIEAKSRNFGANKK